MKEWVCECGIKNKYCAYLLFYFIIFFLRFVIFTLNLLFASPPLQFLFWQSMCHDIVGQMFKHTSSQLSM